MVDLMSLDPSRLVQALINLPEAERGAGQFEHENLGWFQRTPETSCKVLSDWGDILTAI
jgi:hypothetical protein